MGHHFQDYWPPTFELNVTAVSNEMFEKILKVHLFGKSKDAHLRNNPQYN